jgi:hypothetical protein
LITPGLIYLVKDNDPDKEFNFYTPLNEVVGGNNSGMAKVKIVKKERDPPLFTSKQLIKF